MFRTRDFVLVFITVVFLVVAIGSTLVMQKDTAESEIVSLQLAEVQDGEYTAEIHAPDTLSRDERLAAMRQKVAAHSNVTLSSAEPSADTPKALATSSSVAPIEPISPEKVQVCPQYQVFTGDWPAGQLTLEEVEGARLISRENGIVNSEFTPQSTTSVAVSAREVVVQLPVRSQPNAQPSCLPSDVVGIAKDGSLIRNTEAPLYSVFGSDTLIGYSLDGFPIYGLSNLRTDLCGGALVNGSYRYILSDERETILNCFSAQPVSL